MITDGDKQAKEKAVRTINNALYFDDGSDYETALWEALNALRPDMFDEDGLIDKLEYIPELK
jgi:hypothetical protein